jgi:ATP adenylyltransferase
MVRIAVSLAKKPSTSTQTGPSKFVDPFENPPTQKLYGGPITSTHSLIFNKFNLVEDHMVIVTNEMESQSDPLSLADVEAVWKCLAELGGMGFFNGGPLAGSSQPHKHLQFLPTPLVPGSHFALPIESILLDENVMQKFGSTSVVCDSSATTSQNTSSSATNSIIQPFIHPSLPFFNLFALIPYDIDPHSAPKVIHQLYIDMLRQAEPVYIQNNIERPFCFNLLFMKKWILLVPRSRECVEDTTISINSMGFAGSLFVKSTEHFDKVKELGPMGVLKALTLPISPSAAL